MVKMYNVQQLRPGMVIGRDVKKPDGSVLLSVKTVLSAKSLKILNDNHVISVYIDVPKNQESAELPDKEFLLDDDYVANYERIYRRVKKIYENFAINKSLLPDELAYIIKKQNLDILCDGAKAVSQIHNMDRDEESYLIHHATHVGILCGLTARWLNMSFSKMQDLATAGFLHDIGKVRIPPQVRNKEGKLTSEEFQQMQRHPEFGFDFLKNGPLKKKKDILEGVWQHHERCDGSGYQNRLMKDQINPFARIIAVLDMYDAMASNRSYAQKRSPFEVTKILYNEVLDGKLDAEYAIVFISQIYRCLSGNWVALSDGRTAKIVYINEANPTSQPIVQTLDGEFIDLNVQKRVTIGHILTANEVS